MSHSLVYYNLVYVLSSIYMLPCHLEYDLIDTCMEWGRHFQLVVMRRLLLALLLKLGAPMQASSKSGPWRKALLLKCPCQLFFFSLLLRMGPTLIFAFFISPKCCKPTSDLRLCLAGFLYHQTYCNHI